MPSPVLVVPSTSKAIAEATVIGALAITDTNIHDCTTDTPGTNTWLADLRNFQFDRTVQIINTLNQSINVWLEQSADGSTVARLGNSIIVLSGQTANLETTQLMALSQPIPYLGVAVQALAIPSSGTVTANLFIAQGGGSSGGGGGGGAVTAAAGSYDDGALVTMGLKADTAWDGSAGSASEIAILKKLHVDLAALGAITAAVNSYADGALVTMGLKADTAWSGSGSGSEIAILKSLFANTQYQAPGQIITITPPSSPGAITTNYTSADIPITVPVRALSIVCVTSSYGSGSWVLAVNTKDPVAGYPQIGSTQTITANGLKRVNASQPNNGASQPIISQIIQITLIGSGLMTPTFYIQALV